MEYKVQRFAFAVGERFALLTNAQTGIPLMHQNLYVTIHFRNTGKSINTMTACLGDLKLLEEICEYLGIQLEQRFTEGKLLTKPEMESISYWAKKSKVALKKAQKVIDTENVVDFKPSVKRLESIRYTVAIDTELVETMTSYNRLSNIISFTVWLANSLAPEKVMKNIEKMEEHFKTYRPTTKNSESNNRNSFKSLTESQMIRILDIIRPDSSDNPWKDLAIRYRNQMIINVIYDVGCRLGEILTLKATEIEAGSNELKIRRSADDPNDNRIEQPLVKTLGRDVAVSDDVFEMVESYIIKYRSQVKGSGKNPFLILSHQSGAKTSKALSVSGLRKVFKTLSEAVGFKVTPHPLRHTWNDEFSEEVEAAIDAGEMTEDEAEETRSYLMGWKENSGTAKYYTKRYQQKKSLRFALKLQEKKRSRLNKIVGQYDEDIDF
ncbi:MAG: integrase [Psychroserpens sp.]|jgi:integrase